MIRAFDKSSPEAPFVSIGQAARSILQDLGVRRPGDLSSVHQGPVAETSLRYPIDQGATGVITTTIQNVERAEPVLDSGLSWVTLRLGGNNRVTIHTVNYGQAVAVADAFNSELEACEDGRR